MTAFVYRPGHELADEFGMVPKHLAGPRNVKDGGPQIISDHMDATWHPCDGKQYDSKSKFREITRAHGGIEMGNEKITPRKKQEFNPPDKVYHEAIERAIYEIQNPWARK